VFADGLVEDEERKMVESIQGALGIPNETALKILEVTVIKNRG
jgi:tellurite resistance protein